MPSLRHRVAKLALEDDVLKPHLAQVIRQAADTSELEDEADVEGKFEKGKKVPLSKLPQDLQDNAENPPAAVKELKDKMEGKTARLSDGQHEAATEVIYNTFTSAGIKLREIDEIEFGIRGKITVRFDWSNRYKYQSSYDDAMEEDLGGRRNYGPNPVNKEISRLLSKAQALFNRMGVGTYYDPAETFDIETKDLLESSAVQKELR